MFIIYLKYSSIRIRTVLSYSIFIASKCLTKQRWRYPLLAVFTAVSMRPLKK